MHLSKQRGLNEQTPVNNHGKHTAPTTHLSGCRPCLAICYQVYVVGDASNNGTWFSIGRQPFSYSVVWGAEFGLRKDCSCLGRQFEGPFGYANQRTRGGSRERG